MHTQLGVSEYNCIYFPPLHFPLRCLCTYYRASVLKSDVSAHPQAHRVTLSMISWKRMQDGGTSKIAQNTGTIGSHEDVGAAQVTMSHRWFACVCKKTWQGLIWRFNGSKASQKGLGRVWMLIIRAEVTNPYLWTQSEQSNYTICTSRQNTHPHHVHGGQSEDTQAPATKRGITSVTTSSRQCFHAKMCEENPEIKK